MYQNAVESVHPGLVPCLGSQQRLLTMMLEMYHFMQLASCGLAYDQGFLTSITRTIFHK